MMWKDCTLYAETIDEENTDELGNPAKGKEQVWTGQVRFTPWTEQQIALEGREVTKTEQLYSIPVDYSTIQFCKWAEMDGVMLKVKEVEDLSPRWSVIRVVVHKNG